MSFLDNLENNLKSLESAEDGRADKEQQRRARAMRVAGAQAAAPHAEELKKGPYTAELLKQAARVGHSMRMKVHIAWLGSNLRLEVRNHRLEFRPMPDGIVAAYLENNQEIRTERLDLKGSPEELMRAWLTAAAPPPAPPVPDDLEL